MRSPRVCAVVPTFNRKELLRECLTAIQAQTRRPDAVMVLDNASDDGSRELVAREFPNVTLVTNRKNTGSAGGFAQGIRWGYERGFDWLWLVDNDAVAEPNCLKALLESADALEARGLEPTALGSMAHWTDGRPHPMNLALPDWYKLSLWGPLRRLGIYPKLWVTWVSVLLPRRAVERIGLPHADFFTWNEDMEYTKRLSRRGVCAMVEGSRVVHKTETPYTPASSAGPRYYYEVRNKIWVLRGRTFRPLEKVWLLGCVLGNTLGYLRRNRKEGWRVVRRGLRDGLRRSPDPELVKL